MRIKPKIKKLSFKDVSEYITTKKDTITPTEKFNSKSFNHILFLSLIFRRYKKIK